MFQPFNFKVGPPGNQSLTSGWGLKSTFNNNKTLFTFMALKHFQEPWVKTKYIWKVRISYKSLCHSITLDKQLTDSKSQQIFYVISYINLDININNQDFVIL